MRGLLTVFRKELADQMGSRRLVVLVVLVLLAGLFAAYGAARSISQNLGFAQTSEFVFLQMFTSGTGVLPSFVSFVSFFGPLLGLALGFDAINREHGGGTLSLVLGQPVFRDSLINGKFLAGLVTIALMMANIVLIVAGLGLYLLGVPPSGEEVLRIIAYTLLSIVYIGFWMALGLLFSVFFRRITTSALAGLAVWMFFFFFMGLIATLAAGKIVPTKEGEAIDVTARRFRVEQSFNRLSPATLYGEATNAVLTPDALRAALGVGTVLPTDIQGMIPGLLPLDQSLLLVWPHVVSLIALILACFTISYARFMREEIRGP